MSRFIDKLEQVSQAVFPPMGFRVTQTVLKPRMLLIAHLSQVDIDRLADCVAGSDAGLMDVPKLGSGAKILEEAAQAVPDIPWGGWLANISRGGIKQLEKAGGDFLFFPADKMSLALLEVEKIGKILVTEALLNEGLIKAINELPADAVFITSQQRERLSLTWQHLMLFKRFAALSGKPLLVPVPSDVAASELQALWDMGVDGVVVKVVPGQPVDRLKELRQLIDGLILPKKRKRVEARAIVPSLGEVTTSATEEEEEE